jgi:hydroxymethylbilane synthase
MKVVIGARGSKLSLAQAEGIAARLRDLGAEVSLEILRTTGDVTRGSLATAGFGVFVKEIEQALRQGAVSLAVHSLKDLPTGPREGLTIAAVPEREDPRDALVTVSSLGLADLPAGSRVATGSPRRVAQLRAYRRDLSFVPVRGNVDTRLRKLDQGDFEALVVACAGLARLNLEVRITERIPFDLCLPAPGQGALALQTREDDLATQGLVRQLDHAPTRAAVTAERAFLEVLAGGCTVPAGALATVEGERVTLRGCVADPSGEQVFRGEETGPAAEPAAVGRALAERLLAEGAHRILEVSA